MRRHALRPHSLIDSATSASPFRVLAGCGAAVPPTVAARSPLPKLFFPPFFSFFVWNLAAQHTRAVVERVIMGKHLLDCDFPHRSIALFWRIKIATGAPIRAVSAAVVAVVVAAIHAHIAPAVVAVLRRVNLQHEFRHGKTLADHFRVVAVVRGVAVWMGTLDGQIQRPQIKKHVAVSISRVHVNGSRAIRRLIHVVDCRR